MINKLVEQYSRFLDERDTKFLFDKLENKIGNLQDTAKECNITRKTVYDWKNLTQEMKLRTKEKILEQSLEKLRLDTMEFLTDKMMDIVSELLYTYLLTIYKNIFDFKDAETLNQLFNKFEKTKSEYAGILHHRFAYEVEDLSDKLVEYIRSYGNEVKSAPFYLYNTDSVADIVKEIVFSVTSPEYSDTPEELAIRLRIPIEIVNNAMRILPISKSIARPKLYDSSGTRIFMSLTPTKPLENIWIGQEMSYQPPGATAIVEYLQFDKAIELEDLKGTVLIENTALSQGKESELTVSTQKTKVDKQL